MPPFLKTWLFERTPLVNSSDLQISNPILQFILQEIPSNLLAFIDGVFNLWIIKMNPVLPKLFRFIRSERQSKIF